MPPAFVEVVDLSSKRLSSVFLKVASVLEELLPKKPVDLGQVPELVDEDRPANVERKAGRRGAEVLLDLVATLIEGGTSNGVSFQKIGFVSSALLVEVGGGKEIVGIVLSQFDAAEVVDVRVEEEPLDLILMCFFPPLLPLWSRRPPSMLPSLLLSLPLPLSLPSPPLEVHCFLPVPVEREVEAGGQGQERARAGNVAGAGWT